MLIQIYDAIHKVLSNDAEILSLLKIDTTKPQKEVLLQKAKRIQRRLVPDCVLENIPLLTFYKESGGGVMSWNDQVYSAQFTLDVYTKGEVDRAMAVADRIEQLFDGQFLDVAGYGSFRCEWLDGYEIVTDHHDLFGMAAVIRVSVEKVVEGI